MKHVLGQCPFFLLLKQNKGKKMINKLELSELPFVDGVPDAPQKRIQWIREGDCMSAAKTKYGNEGNLNAAALGVQKNVETLEKNDTTTKDKVNEIVDSVNQIKEALDISTDASIIQQIETNRLNISTLQTNQAETDIALLDTNTNLGELQEDVGYYNPLEDGPYLTVRANINRIKREMGHYANQDINGDPLPEGETNDATGMKRIIIDNSTAIATTQRRLTILEDNYNDSDVGGLTIKLNEMREELGPRTEGTGKSPVYTRLTNLENKTETNELDIGNIKDAIGYGIDQSINNRVGTLEVKTVALETKTSGMDTRLTKVETDIGTEAEPISINGRLATLRTDMTDVRTVIGENGSAGLQGQVVALNVAVGLSDSPAPTSLIPRMQTVENTSRANSTAIQNIQAEIGNNQSGLKGSILAIKSQIEGTNPSGSTVAEKGILPAVETLNNEMSTKISDAPTDAKTYGRREATWVEVATGGDVSALTLRVDGIETRTGEAETKITELEGKVSALETELAKRPPVAPAADGLPYVLVDNAWVLLSTFVTVGP